MIFLGCLAIFVEIFLRRTPLGPNVTHRFFPLPRKGGMAQREAKNVRFVRGVLLHEEACPQTWWTLPSATFDIRNFKLQI